LQGKVGGHGPLEGRVVDHPSRPLAGEKKATADAVAPRLFVPSGIRSREEHRTYVSLILFSLLSSTRLSRVGWLHPFVARCPALQQRLGSSSAVWGCLAWKSFSFLIDPGSRASQAREAAVCEEISEKKRSVLIKESAR